MRVAVTGATGFVGGYVVLELLKRGHSVIAIVRRPALAAKIRKDGVEIREGDVRVPPEMLVPRMRGADAVVHLVGIIRERRGADFETVHDKGARNVVAAAKTLDVKKFVHMSALGTRPNARSRYHRTKRLGEIAVENSGLKYTIFRPSIIFGPGDEFMAMIRGFYKLPVIVVPGSGTGRLQPVHAADVAKLFVSALENPKSDRKAFDVGGPRAYAYNELLDVVGRHLGKSRPKIHMPMPVMRLGAFSLEMLFKLLPGDSPLTRDQLLMLPEDNSCDIAPLKEAFGFEPISLEEGIKPYL